jgi:hypothetical protein
MVRRSPAGLLILLCLMSCPFALAEEPAARAATLRLDYQYVRTGEFYDASPVFGSGGDVGTTKSHALIVSGHYPIAKKWTVFASLPYIRKKHEGTAPHDFTEFVNFDPPDRTLVDDGDFHGGLQDLNIGIGYQATDGPLVVSPFVSYGVPTNDYPFYGKAIIGTNLWQLPIGVRLEYQPYFSDWNFSGEIAYIVSERPLDVNVNYWLLQGKAGYYFSQRFMGSAFVTVKDTPAGLTLPDDFTDDPTYQDPTDFDSEVWWQHDRVLAHSFVNVGLGGDYILSRRYQLSGRVYQTVDVRQSNEIDFAFSVGIAIRFD